MVKVRVLYKNNTLNNYFIDITTLKYYLAGNIRRAIFMHNVHKQIQMRRKALGILQKDMESLIGMKQAQYQKLEAGGNTKLRTLKRVLKILKLEIIVVPKEKLDNILPLLDKETSGANEEITVSLLEKYGISEQE